MFFRPAETQLIARLDRRIAEIMNLPVSHGEGLQILHYPEGAGSAPHYDFLVPSNPANQASIARSGQRVSTLVTYLNDVPAGGETVFPAAGWAVSPQRGNAVYFEYANSHGELDHASLHASSIATLSGSASGSGVPSASGTCHASAPLAMCGIRSRQATSGRSLSS